MKMFSPILLMVLLLGPKYATCHHKDWWEQTIFYQIYPRSFMDSDGDGIGDLNGITSKLSYLKETGIGATWLSPIFESPMVDFGYDISNYTAIQAEYGTMEDFENMITEANRLGIKIILDFVPNHSSDKCSWFLKSVYRDPGYENYYVWHDGYENPAGGDRLPPNNWQSVFYGSAWTFNSERKQFYLHQFTAGQPDLNFRNPVVVQKMKNILRFWLAKGVAGFRIDAVNHLFEISDLRNEPETGTDTDPMSYGFTHHYYTKDLPEVYDMVYQWRDVLDEWKAENGGDTRIIMTEAYANLSDTMKYYESEDGTRKGSHMPFNFMLITDLKKDSTSKDFVYVINKWLTYMPRGETPNWVIGNHDQPRVGSRFGYERIDAINTLLLTLPGAGVTYNGEEIGMMDYRDISWEDTQDPAACNTNADIYMEYSRDPERTPFQWDSTNNAGFSSANTTWLPVNPNYKSLNLKAQKESERSHYKLYKTLAKLRRHETFKHGTIQLIPYNNNVLTYIREYENHDTFVIVINLGKHTETVNLSVFPRLSNTLKVMAASSVSSHKIGDDVESKNLIIGPNDSLVLHELSRKRRSIMLTTIQDIALITTILITMGTSYYHFYYCNGCERKTN